jgi:SAM-dependent methyltransferase
LREYFVGRVLKNLGKEGLIDRSTRILAVCAGVAEASVFEHFGFENVTLTNVNAATLISLTARYVVEQQDAEHLTYPDKSFDFVFVSDGLHHCQSPHRALLEMYRVSRLGVLVFESEDNFATRLATKCRLAERYEVSAVKDSGGRFGGVNNTEIPNFVYRWTQGEFEKTLCSFDPTGPMRCRYYRGLSLPLGRLWPNARALRSCGHYLERRIVGVGNLFCMVALRPAKLWPWLRKVDISVRWAEGLNAK